MPHALLKEAVERADPAMAMLRTVVDQAPSASYLFDLDGRLLHGNRHAAHLVGRNGFDGSGISIHDLLHPEDLLEARWLSDSLLEGRRSACSAEYRFRNAKGDYIWVDLAISLALTVDGTPTGYWVQAIDIDNRKRDQRMRADNEKRWTHALESAGQGVWEADLTTDTVHYSPTWRKLRGIAPEEHIDSSQTAWLARIHPADRETVLAYIHNSGETSRSVFEYRERHRDGHYIWIQSRGCPVEFDDAGNPTHIVGTDTDVTELKKMQSRSESLAQRLEMALSISGIGVFEVDLTSGAIFYDTRLREILSIPESKQELTLDDFAAILHPEDAERVMSSNDQIIAHHGAFETSFRILRPDGEVRIIKSHSAFFESESGSPMLIGTNWDVTDDVARQESLVAAHDLAERLAMLDPLTELSNRRHLDELLQQATGPVGVLHLDLDRFKQINDGHGHLAGDAVLKHVAGVLRAVAGPGDVVARVGGDEFVILRLSAPTRQAMEALANRISDGLSCPYSFKDHVIPIGASMGIAISTSGKQETNRLLSDADAALYRAKQTGRGHFEVFSDSLKFEIEQNKRTSDDVLRSVENKEFVPYYQPVVDARTFGIVGVEALARWSHPEFGIMPPSSFLRTAEELDVLGDIDRIILEKTVADLDDWRRRGIPIPAASVNLSFQRLHDDDLVATLRALDFEPGTLNVELLESIFLDDLDDCFSTNLDGIRRMGIGVDIDDFGTGHTSFLSLFKLHPRRFKIDRQLVSPILSSPEQRKIVKSLIGIGKTLGIEVVAEGVETMEHAHVLRRLGCDYLQGYAFARPLPAADIEAWALRDTVSTVVPTSEIA